MNVRLAAAILALGLTAAAAPPATHPGDIVVGTHLDLSGPLSSFGNAVRNGIVMAFDQTNAQGGVAGRKLRLIALDDGFNPRRALSATKTLLYRDHVLAILCPVGTQTVAKTMPLVLNNGTLHLFPFASTDETYVPLQPLEFAVDLPAAKETALGLAALLQSRGPLKVGVLYRNDTLGQAVLKGATAEAAKHDMLAKTSAFEPGTADFREALSSLRDGGAEVVVIGGVAQEAITIMQQAAAQSWFPVFLCNDACYVPELPTLGGRAVSGLYAVAAAPVPYPDDADPRLRAWVRRYEERFGTVASAQAFRAFLDARLFVQALRRASPNLSPRRVARALETLSPWVDPDFGGIALQFTSRDHVGFRSGFLAQVRDGRWTRLTGPLPAPGKSR